MTEMERDLCRALMLDHTGKARISKDEFKEKFPSAVEGGVLAPGLLKAALESRDAKEVQYALVVGANFGFSRLNVDVLSRLAEADWHRSHEDVITALARLRDPASVAALVRATQWVPKYLEWDKNRALAVKAIWGLGGLEGVEAQTELERIARSPEKILKENAQKQLERRHRG